MPGDVDKCAGRCVGRLYTEFRLREDHLRLLGCCGGEEPEPGQCYRVVVDGRERFVEVVRTGVPLVEKSVHHLPCRVIGPPAPG